MTKHYIFTPFAPVLWASLLVPKAYSEADKEKYEIKLGATPEQIKQFVEDIKKMIGPVPFKVKSPVIGISVSKAGEVTIKAASLYKPAIFDMKNNKLEDPKVGNESIARAYCELNVHDKGVGLRLLQVQIKELKEYESRTIGASAFDEGEGYEGKASAFGDATEGDEPDSSGGSALDI